MRTQLHIWGICVVVACAGIAAAAPPPPPAPGVDAKLVTAKLKEARRLKAAGDAEKGLVIVDEGLLLAPKNPHLLALKGDLLLDNRDVSGALEAYEAALKANPPPDLRRTLEAIIKELPSPKTLLEVTVSNGPAKISTLLPRSEKPVEFCTAAPSCSKQALPGPYRVIAERPGFERWTGAVRVESNKAAKLAITLVEKPSPLTVKVTQPGATITVDGAPYDPKRPLPAGPHRVVVTVAGHAEERIEVAAHEGKPVDLDVSLTPIIPVRITPAEATLTLDDKPVTLDAGGIAVPPGAHKLVARAGGFTDYAVEIPVERPPGYEIALQLAPIPVPPPTWTTRRKVAVAVGGVGVAAAAAGVVLGLQSKSLEDDAFAKCPSPEMPCPNAAEANDLNKRGRSRALQANIAYGVAAGAGITAAVLWFTGAAESRIAVVPQVGTQPGASTGVDVIVKF